MAALAAGPLEPAGGGVRRAFYCHVDRCVRVAPQFFDGDRTEAGPANDDLAPLVVATFGAVDIAEANDDGAQRDSQSADLKGDPAADIGAKRIRTCQSMEADVYRHRTCPPLSKSGRRAPIPVPYFGPID